jgi:RNA polymerase sigma-70 factor (ECF subfamily)
MNFSPQPPTDLALLRDKALAAAELVARIRAGDAKAETELIERYRRGVSFLLRELTRDVADAEDLEQETFRLALEKVRAGELREPEKLVGFLRSLARNLFLGEQRRRKKQVDVDDVPLADSRLDPFERTRRHEDSAVLRQLLTELEQERDREILLRFYLEEQERDRVCRELGLTEEHFHRVIHRARNRFRVLLEKSGEWSGFG